MRVFLFLLFSFVAQLVTAQNLLLPGEYADLKQDYAKEKSSFSESASTNSDAKFDLIVEQTVPANYPILTQISYKGIDNIHIDLYKVSAAEVSSLTREKMKEVVRQNHQTYYSGSESLPDYLGDSKKVEFFIPELDEGYYVVDAYSILPNNALLNSFEPQLVHVSNLFVMADNSLSDSTTYYVLDRRYGRPIEGVKIVGTQIVCGQKKRFPTSIYASTSVVGGVKLVNSNCGDGKLYFTHKRDTLALAAITYKEKSPFKIDEFSSVYTDHSAYVVGEQLNFKGYIYDKGIAGVAEAKENRKVELGLFDPYGNLVFSDTYTSGFYGSYSGFFPLAENLVSGTYTFKYRLDGKLFKSTGLEIYINNPTATTYVLKLQGAKDVYKANDKKTIKGVVLNAQGGRANSVSFDLSIKERVVNESTGEVVVGKTLNLDGITTNAKGNFLIDLSNQVDITQLDASQSLRYVLQYKFKQGNGIVSHAYQAFEVKHNANDYWKNKAKGLVLTDEKGKVNEVRIKTVASNGAPLVTDVEMTVLRLPIDSYGFIDKPWSESDTVLVSDYRMKKNYSIYNHNSSDEPLKTIVERVDTSAKASMHTISGLDLKDGRYKVELKGKTADNIEVSDVYEFEQVTGMYYRPYSEEVIWVEEAAFDKTYKPGDFVRFKIGSKVRRLKVLMTIQARDNYFSRQWIEVDGFAEVKIPVRAASQGDMNVTLQAVALNHFFDKDYVVNVPWKNKVLGVNLTQVDKPTKGKFAHNFHAKVRNYENKSVASEALVVVYDITDKKKTARLYKGMLAYENYKNMVASSPAKAIELIRLSGEEFKGEDDKSMTEMSIDELMSEVSTIEDEAEVVEESTEVSLDAILGELDDVNKEISEVSGSTEDDALLYNFSLINRSETVVFRAHDKTNSKSVIPFGFNADSSVKKVRIMIIPHSRDMQQGVFVKDVKLK